MHNRFETESDARMTLTQTHRHDDANEAFKCFKHTRAHLVFNFKKYFVFGQSAQWIDQESGIESDLEIRTAVGNGHRLVGLTKVGTGRRNFQKIAGKFNLHRVRLLARHQSCTVHALQEKLALELDALMRFFRNNLLVIGIISVHHFRKEVDAIDQTAGILVGVDLEGRPALIEGHFKLRSLVEHTKYLAHGLRRQDDASRARGGEVQFLADQCETAAVGRNKREFSFLKVEVDPVEDIACFVGGLSVGNAL